MKKKLLTALLSGAIFCGGVQASASSNFFADVPADDWSYSAINELIATGKVNGYVRFRNDHFIKDDKSGTKTGTTRANMVHLQVATHYKINKDWEATLDMGYRNSLSGFD